MLKAKAQNEMRYTIGGADYITSSITGIWHMHKRQYETLAPYKTPLDNLLSFAIRMLPNGYAGMLPDYSQQNTNR